MINELLMREMINELSITDLIVWGLKTNKHTHYYIHKAVYYAFQEISKHDGFKVHWFDDIQKSFKSKDWMGRKRKHLIFCSPQYDTDKYIPIIDDAYYIIHADNGYCYDTNEPILKYDEHVRNGAAIFWKVFRGYPSIDEGYDTIDRSRLIFYNNKERRIIMPWATDLLPKDIEITKDTLKIMFQRKKLFLGNQVVFIGSVWQYNEDTISKFADICRKNQLEFNILNLEDMHDCIHAIRSSYMAPAIQGVGHQTESENKFYVPCRIFKNISYGSIGVTNNVGVNKFFNDNLVCNKDFNKLIKAYKEYVIEFSQKKLDKMINLMEEIQNYHTYYNRIFECMKYLKKN